MNLRKNALTSKSKKMTTGNMHSSMRRGDAIKRQLNASTLWGVNCNTDRLTWGVWEHFAVTYIISYQTHPLSYHAKQAWLLAEALPVVFSGCKVTQRGHTSHHAQ